MKQYTVLFERSKHSWSASVPDLPGCITTGRTREQIERFIQEAIRCHVEGLVERGEFVPEPSIEAGVVTVRLD